MRSVAGIPLTRQGRGRGSVLFLALLGACASSAPPPIEPPVAPANAPRSAPRIRVGVLPPDALPFGEVAAALGRGLEGALSAANGRRVRGSEVVAAKVSMEVAQLSLECVSPTNDCYAAVGRFLQVDRLLWGQAVRDGDASSVKITVIHLDVGRRIPLGRAERTFTDQVAAVEGVQAVVDQAMAPLPASPDTTPTITAAQSPPAPSAAAAPAAARMKERP
jgi:hypothetical protein